MLRRCLEPFGHVSMITSQRYVGWRCRRLPWDHKDPFDRVIVAQALRRNLTIATRDAKIVDAALTPTLQA
ncbi:hypothetical protein MSIM_49010 [Mycobacterium simiae]|nr:hypothetical protein MSIM_49010 [Mycobacterium simiae]